MTDTLTAPALSPSELATGRSGGRWPLTGVLAGLLGIAGTLALDLHPTGIDVTDIGVVDQVSRGKAQAGLVVGYLCVAALLVLAAQWRRFVEPRVPASTAARVVSGGLTAAAGALALGYGWKGMFAVYLPGGINDDAGGGFDKAGLYTMYVLNDFGAFIGWLGVVIAAGAVAWMAFRERTVSRWIGAVSLVPVLAVTAFAVLTGLPGFPGMVGPLWMVVAFAGLAFGKSTISR
jgi:hypothetical protein